MRGIVHKAEAYASNVQNEKDLELELYKLRMTENFGMILIVQQKSTGRKL